MADISYFQDIPKLSINYLEKLKLDSNFNFAPVSNFSTLIGRKINMGYNCYGIKLYKISNEWKTLGDKDKLRWTNYLLDFQSQKNDEYKNFFIDPEVVNYFNKKFSTYNAKNFAKKTLNSVMKKDYELKQRHIFKTINADSKQTISTLAEIGQKVESKPNKLFSDFTNVENYLNSYDWSKPWDAGAQFSSIALYNSMFKMDLEKNLIKFLETKLNQETGSYYEKKPKSPRQVINGAMKVISGLDWLDHPVHLPKSLIDFCLENKPEFEGCDLVDYVYVLYKCSTETDYKKKEIIEVLKEVLNYLNRLYHKNENGFSYYINKSQTHYYGIQITKGKNEPDIHGTILSVWAIVMILILLEKNSYDYNIIKP